MRGFAAIVFALGLFASLATAQTPCVEPKDPDQVLNEQIDSVAGELRTEMDSLLSKIKLDFYGHFKLDTSRDSSKTNNGNTALWVMPRKNGERDDEFNMTVRHTRFGFRFTAPDSWGPKTTARLEIDFYGDDKRENAQGVRLRHAYFEMDFGDGWSLLAGQTFDVFSPLFQWKLNTAVGWQQGNLGFRRPMLRGRKVFDLSDGYKLDFTLAAARPISKDMDGAGDDDGEDAGMPDVQGRIGFCFPVFTEGPTTFGVGGFWGRREADFNDAEDRQERYTANAIAFDLTLPITKDLKVLAEAFYGKALESYNSGLKHSLNKTTRKEVPSKGGFVNVIYNVDTHWILIVGAGFDNPRDSRLNAGDRSRNTSIFAGVRYKMTKFAWVGIEADRMDTDYNKAEGARNLRFQLTFMLKF